MLSLNLSLFWRKLERVGVVIGTLSVEPAALFSMTSILMSHLVYTNFLMDRICRNDLQMGAVVCDGIASTNKSYREEEMTVHMEVAKFRTYQSLISNSVPVLFLLFMGAWSDLHGRKAPMLLGLSTAIIQDLLMLVCSLCDDVGGIWLCLLLSLPPCLTGGRMTFSMAAYSYVSDTSDVSTRTLRIGILSAASQLGVPLGFALGGSLLKIGLSFPIMFLISSGLSIAALLIVLIRVKNSKPENKEDHEKKVNVCERATSLCRGLVSVAVRKREDSDRLFLCLLFLVYICVAIPIHGEYGVMYLFLRAQLGWDAGNYGTFAIYNSLISTIGVVMSMGILSHWAKLSDPVVGFVAGIGQFGGCFIYAFARTSFVMYLAPLVDMMNGTMWVVAKSMVSKLVGVEEYGRIFTLFAFVTALVPLAADPMYAQMYKATVTFFPGAFFLISAALTIPPQIIYAGLSWKSRRNKIGEEIDAFPMPKPTTTFTLCKN